MRFPGYDERWRYGMLGWSAQIARECEFEGLRYKGGERGEVTGYEHAENLIWLVFDGEEEPRVFPWELVRPA